MLSRVVGGPCTHRCLGKRCPRRWVALAWEKLSHQPKRPAEVAVGAGKPKGWDGMGDKTLQLFMSVSAQLYWEKMHFKVSKWKDFQLDEQTAPCKHPFSHPFPSSPQAFAAGSSSI